MINDRLTTREYCPNLSLEVDESLGAVKVLWGIIKEEELAEPVLLPGGAAVLKSGMGYVRL